MNDTKEIFNLINKSQSICIAGHKAPDGDCIGSVMALYETLKTLNKDLTVCIDGAIPYNYKAFVDEEIIAKEYNDKKFDLLFILDCSDAERLGKFKNVFENAKKNNMHRPSQNKSKICRYKYN
jgi:bifunctional oligoribonuclease and PAP phosphatase NrnA